MKRKPVVEIVLYLNLMVWANRTGKMVWNWGLPGFAMWELKRRSAMYTGKVSNRKRSVHVKVMFVRDKYIFQQLWVLDYVWIVWFDTSFPYLHAASSVSSSAACLVAVMSCLPDEVHIAGMLIRTKFETRLQVVQN
jgi:hypothetical protein